jgi:DNA polymerase-3 subunit gamma/tau
VTAEPLDTPYQSLYRRFRPLTFARVRGQDHVVLALRNAVRDGRVAHAYLFSGPRGTGKTSTARILAMALNCTDLSDGEPCGVCSSCVEIARGSSLDVHELDAASNNGVEAMRDLVARAALGTPGRQKVYIVDEVHMLSTAASNALLKTLEEPPPHVVFVLATTDPQKVLPTIRSRTQHFEFRLLGPDTLGELLDEVRREAGLDIPDEALALAVRRGRGSARDALSVLDQVVASDSVDDDLPELDEIVESLAERDVGRALAAVAQLTAAGYSPQQLAGDLLDHLRQGFLVLVAPELVSVAGSERDSLATRSERVGLAALVRALEVLGLAQVSMRDAPDPRVNLEVALIRLAHPEADVTPEALLARIERLEAGHTGSAAPSAPAAATAPSGAARAATAPLASVAPAAAAADPAPAPLEPAPPEAPEPDTAAGPAPGGRRRTVGAVRRQAASSPEAVSPTAALAEENAPAGQPPPTGETGEKPPAAPSDGSASGMEPPSGGFPDRDQLVQAWGDHIIGRLRPKAKALFQAGRFMGASEGRAQFGLPNEIHRTRCEELRPEVEQVLSDYFSCHIGLDLVVDPGAEGQPTGPDPAGQAAGGVPTAADGSEDPDGGAGPPAAGSGGRRSARRGGTGGTRGGASAGAGGTTDPPGAGAGRMAGRPPVHEDSDPEGVEDLSSFDESELGEVAVVDNSAQSRVLQAFPGAEEVT